MPPYATYITTASTSARTPLSAQRSFSHTGDSHGGLLAMYGAMQLPTENILITDDPDPLCMNNAHNCVIFDRDVPIDEGRPRYLDQWLWNAGE